MAKTLNELVNPDDPGIALIREWISSADNPTEILTPSESRNEVLLELQVTTRSTLGALAYDTGGVVVDHGWLRFLGSGHAKLNRTLSAWNRGRGDGLYLVADDAVGGFFAINGGALGEDIQNVYYWSPDQLEWESLGIGLTDFFRWSLTSRLADFYEDLRWATWQTDVIDLAADQCFSFYPPLWTKEGSINRSNRRAIPATEAYDVKMEIVRQLHEK
jgi:hypothetical protein